MDMHTGRRPQNLDGSTSPPPRRLPNAATFLIATLILSGAALYNGYPLTYPDSGAYVVMYQLGIIRSVFYSFLIAPARLTHTLWTVVLAQSLLTTVLLRIVLREVFDIVSRLEFIAVIALLSVLTSLPWYTGFIMPDIFTALMVLGLFMLSFCYERLDRWERYFIVALTFVASIEHYSNIPIAVGLLLVGLAARMYMTKHGGTQVPYLALPATVVAGGIAAIVIANYLMFGIVTYSVGGYAFALARLLGHGPAIEVLRENCPTRHYAACFYLKRLPANNEEVLWLPDNLFDRVGFEGESKEGWEIISRTIEEHPRRVLHDAIGDTIHQLHQSHTGDGLRPVDQDPANAYTLRSTYPTDYAAYTKSRQGRGEFTHRIGLWELHWNFLIFSVFYSMFIAILLAYDRQWLPVQLTVTVAFAVLLNAFVSGAIADSLDRYGSRVIWLIPLIAIASWRKALRLSGEHGAVCAISS